MHNISIVHFYLHYSCTLIGMKKPVAIITILLCLTAFAHAQNNVQLYFTIGSPELSSQAKHSIDSFVHSGVIKEGVRITLLGYTDYTGSDSLNLKLSKQRADNAKAYFLKAGFPAERIQACTGKGAVKRTDTLTDHSTDRTVIIAAKKPDDPFTIDEIALIPVGGTFRLDNLYFPPGHHIPNLSSFPELKELLAAMKQFTNLKISIEGHICCNSDSTDDLDVDSRTKNLSENRARFVYDYLVRNGITQSRMLYKGYGFSRPVVFPELDNDAIRKNRRVEVRILEK